MGMDVYGYNGNYFRANIWSWRAICSVLTTSGFDVPDLWHTNDGAGLTTSEGCQKRADLLENFLGGWDGNEFTMETKTIRVDKTGRFVDPDTPDSLSPYSVTREHLEEFLTFLRECGGFEIH